jgi:hypothetical protein
MVPDAVLQRDDRNIVGMGYRENYSLALKDSLDSRIALYRT